MPACANCGRSSPDGFQFCPHCGTPLAASTGAPAEERKVVSVLFADLVGFTARSDRADPEDVRASLHPYHARVKREIERFGGTVEKFVGDAVMAVFGAPVAHEDDAERAVRAALRIPDAVAELNEANPDLQLAVRVAVNTGEALVALGARPEEGEGIVSGDVVNTASRLQQAAPVGGVVVGEVTQRSTGSAIEYEDLEPVSVKGKAEPVPIWLAVQARSRFGVDVEGMGAAFVGREADLAFLQQSFARTLRDQSIQMVTVTGEPGVGKTRLVREFFRHVDDTPGLFYWRQGRCLAYGENVTFWALGEIVKAQAGILESDGPAEAREKLRRAVDLAVDAPAERAWVMGRLAALVGMEGEGGEAAAADRDESFAAWRRFLEGVAAIAPLVIVVEDLHWADPSLLAFLDHLVDWSTGVPMLVICTARPELYEASPGWGGGKRNASAIALSPLSAEETARLIAALLEQAVLPAPTQAALLDRSGGNPLYTEQFVAMLVDRGLLVRDGGGWEIASDVDIPVPESVQSIIAARIDTLRPERKALIHDASVVGKVFWSGALAAMGGVDEQDVIQGLHDLARKELVRPARRSSMEGQAEYAFWHALTRDVAYSQIPRAARSAKHRAAAAWIEALSGDRVSDHAEFVAHHYRQALELGRATGADPAILGDLEERTQRFLVLAGDRARYLDPARAASFYEQALGLTPDGHPDRMDLLVKQTEMAWTSGALDNVTVQAPLGEAVEMFRRSGDRVRAAQTMVRLSLPVWSAGDSALAMRLAEEAVEMLEEEAPGSPELAEAYAALSARKVLAGRYEEALPWATKALALGERHHLPTVLTRARQTLGLARCSMGDMEGLTDLREGVRLALEQPVSIQTANAYVNLSYFLWLTEGPAAALATHRLAMEFNQRRGMYWYVTWSRAETCWFRFELGAWEEVLAIATEVSGQEFQMAVSAAAMGALVRAYRGEADVLGDVEEEFLARARSSGDPQVVAPALGAAIVIEREAGRHAAALDLVREHDARLRGTPDHSLRIPDAVRACAAAGDLELGHRVLEGVPSHTTRHRNARLTAGAILAEAEGSLEEASELHREATLRWAEYGHVLERGHALLGQGRCLVGLGAGPDAIGSLREARSVFAGLGALPLVEESDNLLEQTTALTS